MSCMQQSTSCLAAQHETVKEHQEGLRALLILKLIHPFRRVHALTPMEEGFVFGMFFSPQT
jgi:hypothetical protein